MRPNPSAYLDARGVAHVQMPEQQEGIPGPRIANMVRSLGLSRAAAERLREKMRRADETGDGIEDILREAQRALRAKGVAYYPGAADAPGAPDGIAFVDRGDPKAETLLYDHRDGRFTVNAWGPAVARQRERFQKNNPDPAKRQNPPRTIVCLTGYGDWWSVSEDQWPKVVRAGMAGDNEAAVKQATRVRQKPWAAVGSAVPVLRSVFDFTPEDWEYYDKEVRDAAAAAKRAREAARRKNPQNTTPTGAPMPTQFVTNPRRNPRPRVTPRPSEKTLASALDISLNQAAGLRRFMYIRSPEKILQDTNTVIRGPGFDYAPSEQDTPSEQKGISALLGDWFSPTLIYDHAKEKYVVAAFGDYVRANRSRFGALADTYDHIAPRKNPAFKSPHAGPSVKRMVDFLGISKSDAEMLKTKMNDGATVGSILKAADQILDGNGVESIGGYGGGLSYVNMGDTYDYTLIYDRKSRRFVAAAWGDIVEAQPRRFAD